MATINVFGSHGSFDVDADTGVVVRADQDYKDIVSVDLTERRSWYLNKGINLPYPQPDGDILDFAYTTKFAQHEHAIEDYRMEILLEKYNTEA